MSKIHPVSKIFISTTLALILSVIGEQTALAEQIELPPEAEQPISLLSLIREEKCARPVSGSIRVNEQRVSVGRESFPAILSVRTGTDPNAQRRSIWAEAVEVFRSVFTGREPRDPPGYMLLTCDRPILTSIPFDTLWLVFAFSDDADSTCRATVNVYTDGNLASTRGSETAIRGRRTSLVVDVSGSSSISLEIDESTCSSEIWFQRASLEPNFIRYMH